jgi:ADP-glucose pyrophosphorylase
VEEDVIIEDSIIMDYCVVRSGARLRRAIVDRYNVIGPGERLGYDLEAERALPRHRLGHRRGTEGAGAGRHQPVRMRRAHRP